jgi:leucyl aminopeptidase
MQYNYGYGKSSNLKDDVVVYFATETETLTGPFLKGINAATGGSLEQLINSEEFTGKNGEIASFNNPDGFETSRLLLVGLGKAKKLNADSFRKATGKLSRYKGFTQASSAAIHFGDYTDIKYFQAAIEGCLLGSFVLRDYKTGDDADDKSRLKKLTLVTVKSALVKRLQKGTEAGVIIAEGQLLVRRLTLTPAQDLTPQIYAKEAQKLARKYGFSCTVLDEKAIVKEKMGALLGVSKGSVEPPRFLVMKHNGGKAGQKPVVLIGKGVTFDSGGISLKPGAGMGDMKQDMAGSAVVMAAMVTAARLSLKLNIVGLIPATENMPSGHATRPGDILTSRLGKTIEIVNTDAEGRLILADALDYANKFDPQAVIDVATLTGATLFILGYAGAPIMGNNDKLKARIKEASEATAEKVWELPLWEEFHEQMKSPIADLTNSGGRVAGTAAAGAFLENFVGDWPWVHMDIAYVDLEIKGRAYTPKGATGFGLRLLTELLLNWKKL